MRDIKLRAWDKERSKMIYKFDMNFDDNPTGYVLLQNEDGIIFCGNYLDNGDWNEPELMLCSGQYDKNWKSIYAKDILRSRKIMYSDESFEIREVQFKNGGYFVDDIPLNILTMDSAFAPEIIASKFEASNLIKS